MSAKENLLEKYEPVIGLEVHAQLMTNTKMFCACPNQYGSAPNANICPVCSGQPGSLPVINQSAIELGIRAAVALKCKIFEESVFARKNYFYPDLPKGYQISQYEKPYARDGKLTIYLKSGEEKVIRVHRVHFEEDAGKSVHESHGTLVNLNRAGVPLVEIVSEADMRSSHEAGQYLRALHSVLRYAEVCDGNMEQGNFRCDANISVRKRGEEKFGTKIELKNINSFRFVEKAIDFEIGRQIEAVESGEKLVQQTRLWNSAKNITEPMRDKEEAHDYRYFPEPDLPVLTIGTSWISEIEKRMPELAEAKRARFVSQYGLSAYDAGVLTGTRELAAYYELMTKQVRNAKAAANWLTNELLGKLNAAGVDVEHSPVTASNLADLVHRVDSGEISGKIAKQVFEEMFTSGKAPGDIIKEKGLTQISDASALEAAIQKIIHANPTQVQEYRAGKVKLLGFFVGQVMKETKGQANPAMLNELVKKALDSL